MADYLSQFTGSEIDSRLAKVPQLESGKQDTLVSGTNIKTVNGNSILGSGNLQIQTGETDVVKYTAQTLTAEQKAQARANIDAASLEDINSMDFVTAASLPTASASTMGHIYLIGPDASNNYDRFFTQQDGSSYSWVSLGSTQIDLSTYATQAEVDQLDLKVDNYATGKYYGTFTSSSDLPEGTIPGFAYVGTDNPFEIWNFNGTSWADSGATMDGVNIPSLNPFKGLYNSVSALETAYPNPYQGDYAYVKNSGTPATANIYNVVLGEWADTNIVVDITDMESVFPLSAKLMLVQTLEKVAWIDANGATYLNDLKTALLGNIEIVSISAVFNPGTAPVLDTMPLDKLKQYLTVTATFSDTTTETVTGYALSGSMTAGTNTITVTYMGKTTTFSATVKHNYAGALSTWTLHPQSGVAEYVNGYIREKCVTSSMQSGYSVWVADAAKSTWGQVNGKKLKFRLLINSDSSSIGAYGPGIYSSSSPTSLGNAYSRRVNLGTGTLADDGYYEWEKVMDLADFTYGTYTPTTSSAFGLYAYARALNDYFEIYDVQIFEVE